MEVGLMQREWVQYIKSLLNEGTLDSQYLQLLQLQDESNPTFVSEVVTLFFEDTVELLNKLCWAVSQPSVDFKKIDDHVHQLKGSSSSIGALGVKNVCITFRSACEQQSTDGCVRCLQQVQQEFYGVKEKLGYLFALEKRILDAGGSIPMDF
ncbi:histidine-containing phosphotransfer protein 1-like [Momordica charantia]|uniref:Histidine-containing phosphotransfer protein n=1 Tax=Momordica charantia TaxID=3673 RepID=A0A6J1C8H2_MOMCH|nr:histidine-containing phosphotransfer protein 1-like [Momordica charantia]